MPCHAPTKAPIKFTYVRHIKEKDKSGIATAGSQKTGDIGEC